MASSARLYEQRGETSVLIDAEIDDSGDLQVSGQDLGRAPEEFWGDTDYEYWVIVRRDHKDRLLLALIERVFAGHPTAVSEFAEFLKSHGIPGEGGSWV